MSTAATAGQPAANNEGESANESGTESEEGEDVQPPLVKK